VQSPEQVTSSNNEQPISRRQAVLRSTAAMLGLAGASVLLGGCSSSSGTNRHAYTNGPTAVPPSGRRSTDELLSRWGNGSARRPTTRAPRDWQPLPDTDAAYSYPEYSGLMRRASWSKGNPVPSLMDRMLPIDKITIHHDGMSTFTSTSQTAAAARIESIRRAHRNRNWGDIGYHYLIDPSGRVWEGRPLSWQGAHVKDNNEGNIGVCMLGNYEEQRLSEQQSHALDQFLASSLRGYRIPRSRVYTHKEFSPTACPGHALQSRMDVLRTSRNSALASL
jgi:hypothetical protein